MLRQEGAYEFIRRGGDILTALLLMLLLSPLLLLLAIVVRLSLPGSVIFRQQRAGRYGCPFAIYKFRTLPPGIRPQGQQEGPIFKIAATPGRPARIMRRFSLDELPQLWNVLRGDMSLVGPRPLPVEDIEDFRCRASAEGDDVLDWLTARSAVRPGITGLWQVSGRNDLRLQDWVRLDNEYLCGRGLKMDLKVLWCTLPAVLTGRGAR